MEVCRLRLLAVPALGGTGFEQLRTDLLGVPLAREERMRGEIVEDAPRRLGDLRFKAVDGH